MNIPGKSAFENVEIRDEDKNNVFVTQISTIDLIDDKEGVKPR